MEQTRKEKVIKKNSKETVRSKLSHTHKITRKHKEEEEEENSEHVSKKLTSSK